MKKSYFVLALLTVTMFFALTESRAQVKLQDAEDRISRTPQWSLYPVWGLRDVLNRHYNLCSEIPAIGIYKEGSNHLEIPGYRFRKRLLVINMNENALEVAPRNLRQSITPGITQFQNIAEVLFTRDNRCYVTAVITGNFKLREYPMVGNEMNISFHGFLTNIFPHLEEFSYDMPVGLFVPKGVGAAKANNIPVERLSNQLVMCSVIEKIIRAHTCSPNNSRFKPFTTISSFWTVAKVGAFGDTIIVTYHLLLNSKELSDVVEHIINNATENRHYATMLDSIRNVADELEVDEFSAGILRDWIDNVKHISRPF
ncbi:hypothetical protein P0136_06180 [Lentisphaerota bacterium ZTH]|nr:hypothetical protein JYG24_02710 [Lentisphaerota bacterium]WET07577.1 hypothetical protein P0136_06180 [Lentisphaerota bacterium ZTH]